MSAGGEGAVVLHGKRLKVKVVIDGEVYEVEVEDVADSTQPATPEGVQSIVLPSPGSGLRNSDTRIYVSPVAGLVARIIVEPGREVQKDDVLLVLEAMKMETSITAAVSGKVNAVHVKQGEAVKVGQVLLEFE